jgi:hypothetical protein
MKKIISFAILMLVNVAVSHAALADTLSGHLEMKTTQQAPPRRYYVLSGYKLLVPSPDIFQQLMTDYNNGINVSLIGEKSIDSETGEPQFKVDNFAAFGGGIANPR